MLVNLTGSFLDDDLVIRIYRRLLNYKIRSLVNDMTEEREGQIDGYMQCLAELFGETDEDILTEREANGTSTLQFIDRMAGDPDVVQLVDDIVLGGELAKDYCATVDLIRQTAEKVCDAFAVGRIDTMRSALLP